MTSILVSGSEHEKQNRDTTIAYVKFWQFAYVLHYGAILCIVPTTLLQEMSFCLSVCHDPALCQNGSRYRRHSSTTARPEDPMSSIDSRCHRWPWATSQGHFSSMTVDGQKNKYTAVTASVAKLTIPERSAVGLMSIVSFTVFRYIRNMSRSYRVT